VTDFRRSLAADRSVGAGNFFYRFAEYCAEPDSILLESDVDVVIGDQNLGRSLSAAVIHLTVEQLVASLLAHGVRPRQPVGVFLADSPLYYLYYIALSRIGAISVQLNSKMSGSTAAAYLRRVGCRSVVLDAEHVSRLAPHTAALADDSGMGPRVILNDLLQLDGPSASYEAFAYEASDVVLVAHTSGTTGTPKPVQFTHAGYFFGVRQQMSHVLGPKVLSALPHSHGAAMTLFMSTVVRGLPLYAQTQKDPESLLQTIEAWRPNLVMAFPKPLVDLCRVGLDDRDLSSVSCWMSTGDASHEPHIRRLVSTGSRMVAGRRRKGSLFVDNLGSSEFAFGIFRAVHSPETDSYERCIGRPYEWVDVQIFGEDGQPVKTGQVGRLGVKSASVTSGYWNDPVTTQAALLHGYWLTGDLIYRAENGLYYHVDRTVDRTLLADRALYSCQLEECLLRRIPEIFDCTVVGVTHDATRASGLALAIDLADRDCDRSALEARVHELLATLDIAGPVRIDYVDADWQEGLTGKKLKRLIRDGLTAEAAP